MKNSFKSKSFQVYKHARVRTKYHYFSIKTMSVLDFSKTKVSIMKSFAMLNRQALTMNFYISILILGWACFSSSTKCS